MPKKSKQSFLSARIVQNQITRSDNATAVVVANLLILTKVSISAIETFSIQVHLMNSTLYFSNSSGEYTGGRLEAWVFFSAVWPLVPPTTATPLCPFGDVLLTFYPQSLMVALKVFGFTLGEKHQSLYVK